jgi:uncharacterized protein (TIGR00251 family)
MSFAIDEFPSGVTINVKVVPGASRSRIVGALGDALKIAVSQPPSGGEANRAVIALLAAQLGIHSARVTITAGHSSPRKRVHIAGITTQQLRMAIPIAP